MGGYREKNRIHLVLGIGHEMAMDKFIVMYIP
jgi:hypothetical protein